MKFLTLLFSMLTTLVLGQDNFVPGYFITKDGKRTDAQVLIKREDPRDNPRTFEFRTSDTGETSAVDLTNLIELGFGGSVFRVATVEIDRTPYDVNKLTETRSPEFASEILFLRTLVNGKGSLYEYSEGLLHRYFFSTQNREISQLVYKRYISRNTRVDRFDPKYGAPEVAVNEDFKQQLFNALNCIDVTKKEIENLTYSADKLTDLFTRYNQCLAGVASSYSPSDRGDWPLDINLRVGYAGNNMFIQNLFTGSSADLGMSTVRTGLEFELGLPFKNDYWALPMEIAYMPLNGQDGGVTVDGTSIDVFVGVRRYFPAGKGKFYLTGSMAFAFPNGVVRIVTVDARMQPVFYVAFAGGYKIGRFSAEASYSLDRKLVGTPVYTGKLSGFGLNLGYRLN